jgi:membrane-associated phospholipid phosphatase
MTTTHEEARLSTRRYAVPVVLPVRPHPELDRLLLHAGRPRLGRAATTAARVAVASAAALLSLGIGSSRIYLGYHWATDVLAGWTVAVTWLAIVVTVANLTGRGSAQVEPRPAA